MDNFLLKALQTGLERMANLISLAAISKKVLHPKVRLRNNPDGEYTPGIVGQTRACSHEYYGVNAETVYEVLVWNASCEQDLIVNGDPKALQAGLVPNCAVIPDN